MSNSPHLGLVCISEILKEKKVSFQTMTRKRFLSMDRNKAIADLSAKILNNAKVTAQVIVHCGAVGIKHYRVSSSLFPLVTDATLNLDKDELPDIDAIKAMLKQAGDLARKFSITLSSHPDQFNVLSSYSDDVVDKTIIELNHQAWVLDTMGCTQDYSSPMCLHVSKTPDLAKETIDSYVDRFITNLSNCDIGVISRLVVENEDNGYWNCHNLYKCFSNYMPLVFDNLHDKINPSEKCYLSMFKDTWSRYNSVPVMHWSEGINNTKSHTDYITEVPDLIKDNLDCIWEVEVKAKDKAIIKILKESALSSLV